jgi:hypothetical protein
MPTEKTVNETSERTPPAKRDSAWLSQFKPVPDEELTERQRQFVNSLRVQYPTGRAGYRGPTLLFFAEDPILGRFTGLLPDDGLMSARSFQRIRQMLNKGKNGASAPIPPLRATV